MDLQKYKSPRSGDGIQVVWVAVADVIFIHFYTLEHNELAYSQLILLESRLRGWRSLVPIAELHSLELFATMQWTINWVQFTGCSRVELQIKATGMGGLETLTVKEVKVVVLLLLLVHRGP